MKNIWPIQQEDNKLLSSIQETKLSYPEGILLQYLNNFTDDIADFQKNNNEVKYVDSLINLQQCIVRSRSSNDGNTG